MVQETFFCNICFCNQPVSEGFTLTACGHQFCLECIKGYWVNRINDGQVNIKCFYPREGEDTQLSPCLFACPPPFVLQTNKTTSLHHTHTPALFLRSTKHPNKTQTGDVARKWTNSISVKSLTKKQPKNMNVLRQI